MGRQLNSDDSSLTGPGVGSLSEDGMTSYDLAVCSLFTLRFEAPYLLPWIAAHLMMGVQHVVL